MGYIGYSMSDNAVLAYSSGEKPLSKWTKNELLAAIKSIDSSKVGLLKTIPVSILKDKLLYASSWHHTSKMYNKTYFYSVDEDIVCNLTEDTVKSWLNYSPIKTFLVQYKGDIDYIEWAGTRKYPKAIKKRLENINITEKGYYYIITNDFGVELLRKKIGSNGTYITKK